MMRMRTMLPALAVGLVCIVPGAPRAQEAPEPQAGPESAARIQTRVQEAERRRIREHQPEAASRIREEERVQQRARDARAREVKSERQQRARSQRARQQMQQRSVQRSRSRVHRPH